MAPIPWLAVATAVTAIPPALLFVLVWQERTEPGATPYAYMLATMVVYCLTYAGSLVVADPGIHELVYPATAWVELFVTVPWVLFALEYTGRGPLSTRRNAAILLTITGLPALLLVTPYRTGLLVQQYAVTRNYGVVLGTFEPGPVWVLLALLGLGLLAIGMAMLLEFVVSERERYGIQTAVLAIAGLVPGLTTVARITGLGPLFPFDLTPFAYAFVAPLVGYGMIRWDLFDFAPATQRVGQAAAIDDFGDAVLILDEDYRLVDLNEQAVDLFEESPRSLVGQPVETLIGAPPADIAPEASVRIQTNRGQRDYDVTRSPVEGSRGATIGYTLVLHDVTTEKQRRQRFEVLNRILRHDLRNAMNAIEGYAGELEAHADASVTWMVGRIERQSAHLVDLSEKARDIDRVTTPSHTKSSFAVERSVKRVAEQRPEDGAIVTVHVPDGLTLTSDEAVFEHAVEYAIDCLVSYNDGRETRIVVAATPTGNGRPRIDVRITSDGEPVPAAEREVIKRGEETPLAHSDDLDLWLVLWGVETLGGDLTFVDGDRPGLTLQIPDVR